MSDWKEQYASKKCTADQAAALIQNGMTVASGHAAGEPAALLRALCAQKERLQGIKLYHMNGMTPDTYAYTNEEGWEGKIHHYSLFAGKQTRKAIQNADADFVPCFFSEIPRLFREKYVPLDACFVQLSMPDAEGYCSYGVSCDYAQAMVESAPIVIAQLNAQMPYTYGEKVHVSQLTALVEVDEPVLEVPQFDPDADTSIAEKIAGYVADLIPDGANLQLGIGAIPDMVLSFLKSKKDLGIHTEMFSDGILDLVESGALTGANNTLHPGKITACFVIGTQKIYDFIHQNPMVLMKPVDYTNSVLVAGQMDKLISINSAIQVNLHGEVAADTLGSKQFSGVGGQVDFVRATGVSKGGFSVIAMPSTAKGGQLSRIVLDLTPGACVTTSRNDVHFVATEFGCVNLRGKSVRERALALISIAHPDFREGLTQEARKAGIFK
jgi:4-hydroxybutyrate CoA-transferase